MEGPNFLIIGAARSGTTALYEYLDEHPQVYMTTPKEPHFLAFEGVGAAFVGPGDDVNLNRYVPRDLDAYLAMYRKGRGAIARGEGSVSYLYYPRAPERIKHHFPDAKIVCLLRNPADRAYSAYMYMRSRILEQIEDFREALDAEEGRIRANWHHLWHYRRMGFYGEQLERYYELFPREQIRVYIFEDFRANQAALLKDCSEFLGIDPEFSMSREPSPNVSGVPADGAWSRLVLGDSRIKDALRPYVPAGLKRGVWRKIARANIKPQKVDPKIRAELLDGYRADILKLQDTLGRDLGVWLNS
jgi:hypothetical protein